MPAINRYVLSRGPAEVQFNTGAATAFYLSSGDVTFDAGITTKDLESSAFGVVATIRTNVKPVLSFAPLGMFRDLAVTFGQASLTPGRTLCGALNAANPAVMVDNAIVVRPLDTTQQQTTLYGAALSKVPDLVFSEENPLFSGDINFTIAGASGANVTDANRLYLRANNTLNYPHYDPATLLTQSYNVTCALFNEGNPFATVTGVKVALNLAVEDKTADGLVYDVLFKSLKPTATFQPLGLAEADFLNALNLQGANSAMGQNVATTGADLVIQAPGVFLKLPTSGIAKAGLVYGATAERIASLEMVSGVSVSNQGVVAPRFVLATAPQ